MSKTVEVAAEVIGDGSLARADAALVIDVEQAKADILAMNQGIEDAARKVADCDATDEVLSEMPVKDIKPIESDLAKCIKGYEDARKALKRHLSEPYAAIEAKGKEMMAPIVALHGRYKAARVAAEEAEKQARRASLEQTYHDFDPELAGVVPFERIMEPSWLNKTFGEKKAENALCDKVAGIRADWNSMRNTQYRFPEAAERAFFDTLSLREVNANDARMAAEQERIDAMKAADEANRQWVEQQGAAQEAQPPADAQPAEPPVAFAAAKAEEVFTFVFTVEATDTQKEEVKAYLKSKGIHGRCSRAKAGEAA